MILSFNPVLRADEHCLCAGRDPDAEDLEAIKRAAAVLLPQGRHEALWLAAISHCEHVFPNYAYRYSHPGKIGDALLFAELDLPQPKTEIFRDPDHAPAGYWRKLDYPVVVKADAGGEGVGVHLVKSAAAAAALMQIFAGMRAQGMAGFVVQEYVPDAARSLRVAVIGRDFTPYWRVGGPESFIHNLASGGEVDRESDPELMSAGSALVEKLCAKTGINLAGVDVIFRGETPLLLEINYFFGREGLGGNEAYYARLQSEVDAWLARRGLPRPAGEFDDSLASERD